MNDEKLLTELQISCISFHEIFTELMNAGFTEDQAIYLLSDLMTKRIPG